MKRPKSRLLIDILADAPAVPTARQVQIDSLVTAWYSQLWELAATEVSRIESASQLVFWDKAKEFERLFNGLMTSKICVLGVGNELR